MGCEERMVGTLRLMSDALYMPAEELTDSCPAILTSRAR